MSDSGTPPMPAQLDVRIAYRPYAFDPPANPMGNRMDTPFGSPGFDCRVIQIDGTYQRFIDNYNAVRKSGRFGEYVCEDRLHSGTRNVVSEFIRETLVREYPESFRTEKLDSGIALHNYLLDETILLDAGGEYVSGGRFEYNDNLDALAAQIPEDVAIVQIEDNQDRLAAVHVVAPSGWAPSDKLGGSFVEVHHPVEHHREWLGKIQAGLRNLAKSSRPVQRFGWSMTNDATLNHHPKYGGACGAARVRGDRELYVRVERQVLKGFPAQSALLFTIRVYVERCSDLPPKDLAALQQAVLDMGPEERAYKGVQGDFERIVERLVYP